MPALTHRDARLFRRANEPRALSHAMSLNDARMNDTQTTFAAGRP